MMDSGEVGSANVYVSVVSLEVGSVVIISMEVGSVCVGSLEVGSAMVGSEGVGSMGVGCSGMASATVVSWWVVVCVGMDSAGVASVRFSSEDAESIVGSGAA